MTESEGVSEVPVDFKRSINCDLNVSLPVENLLGDGRMSDMCLVGGKTSEVVLLAEGIEPSGFVCYGCYHAKASSYRIIYRAPTTPQI